MTLLIEKLVMHNKSVNRAVKKLRFLSSGYVQRKRSMNPIFPEPATL